MRVLIIGGTAFSGPHLVARLFSSGHSVALFHRGVTAGDFREGVEEILGDRRKLTDYREKLLRYAPEVVVDMIPLREAEARQVQELFHGVARRVVALSSQDVYRAYGRLIGNEPGEPDPVPSLENSPLREVWFPYRKMVQDETHPLYHYDKIPVEAAYLNDPELPVTILRLPMVYGPRDRQHRLYNYLKRMRDWRQVIFIDENQAGWRTSRGYVEDMAAATALAISSDNAAGRVYNVGWQDSFTEADWIREIGKNLGWGGRVVIPPSDKTPDWLKADYFTAQDLTADTSRIRRELGYREAFEMSETIHRTAEWELEHPPSQSDQAQFDYAAEDRLAKDLGII